MGWEKFKTLGEEQAGKKQPKTLLNRLIGLVLGLCTVAVMLFFFAVMVVSGSFSLQWRNWLRHHTWLTPHQLKMKVLTLLILIVVLIAANRIGLFIRTKRSSHNG